MDKLSEQILSYAVDRTKTQLPDSIEHKRAEGEGTAKGKDKLSLAGEFFSSLEDVMSKNRDISRMSGKEAYADGAQASSFAVSALTRVYMIDKVKKNIDEFISEPKNKALFDGMGDEEKRALSEQLKNTVTEKLSLKPETEQGKAFVQALSDKFNEMTENSNGKSLGAEDSDIGTPEHKFLMEGLSAVHAFNWEMWGRRGFEASIREAKEGFAKSEVANLVLDGIGNNSKELASDSKVAPSLLAEDKSEDLTYTPTMDIDVSILLSPWEKFINLIKNLLRFGNEKTNNAEKQESVDSNRERISFEELSGLNAAEKLTTAPKQKEHSAEKTAEKAAPSKGKN